MYMLNGKNAVITGARRGIGRASVEAFASFGANVWACARSRDEQFESDMQALAKKYEVHIWQIYFDLTDVRQMKAAVQSIRKMKIPIDILVNVAGVVEESTSFAMTSMEKMKRVFDVNFFSLTQLTQYISRIMISQNQGSIVNVSSIAGLDGAPAQYEYAASKAAIIAGTKKLARELADYNIRVNAVAPGIIDTDMGAKLESALKNEIMGKVIMKRVGTPKEVADVCAFLSSDLAGYITGQVIRVDGGM